MAALKNGKKMIEEAYSIVGRYDPASISELTFNTKPFLLTCEADIIGLNVNEFDAIKSLSKVSSKDCKGHFGPKNPSGPESLRVPLLILSRIMAVTAQIAARSIQHDMIPLPFSCKNIRANNQNLIPPPAAIVAIATDLRAENGFFKSRALARADGEPYAEMKELFLKLIPIDQFQRQNGIDDGRIPEKLVKNYSVEKEFDAWDIEDLILERKPFQRLGRAILLRSHDGDLKLITISKITKEDCAGQLLVDGQSTISPIDYAKVMALTAELLASIVTRQRFEDFSVVPIAVKVDKVSTPNLKLLSPPATVIAEASISAKNLNDSRWVKRGKKIFRADATSAWVGGVEVARMKNILYALVPEDGFFEN